jgi:hypothetical protein
VEALVLGSTIIFSTTSKRKSLRQDYLLSPVIFKIVANMLVVLIARAKEDSKFEGLITYLAGGGVSILQYAYGRLSVLLLI